MLRLFVGQPHGTAPELVLPITFATSLSIARAHESLSESVSAHVMLVRSRKILAAFAPVMATVTTGCALAMLRCPIHRMGMLLDGLDAIAANRSTVQITVDKCSGKASVTSPLVGVCAPIPSAATRANDKHVPERPFVTAKESANPMEHVSALLVGLALPATQNRALAVVYRAVVWMVCACVPPTGVEHIVRYP